MKGKVKISDDWLYPAGLAILTLLALWHRNDTSAGAIESGDLWLTNNYMLLAIVVIVCVAVIGFGFFCLQNWKLERLFLLAGICFGCLYLVVLPPLSAPDEVSHYISAYKLSNQMMGKQATEEHGLVYIRQEDAWIEDIYGEFEPGQEGQADLSVLGQTLTEETYQMIHDEGLFGISEEGTTISNQWTVRTTPFAYVPQAIGITLARLFQMSSMGLLYAGRLANLLFYIGVTYLAMKRLPFGKEILFGVALLPMTLHLTGSMSYDVMILALAFYFTAVCLDLAYAKPKVEKKDIVILAAVIAVLGPCKMVYAVVMALCFLIPVRKFGGWKQYITAAAVVLGAFIISMALVNSQTIATYATETESYVMWAEEAGYSFAQLLSSPGLVLKMFYNTVVWQAEYYHLTMIGAYLGNVDLVLDVPYLAVLFLSFCLLGLSFRKPGESISIKGGQRIWVWVICLVCVGATMFSMLLAWTPVSSAVITGVQGRYFLPVLPLFLMSLKNDFVVLSKNADRTILYLMCCVNGYALLRLFSIVSMRL